jgi:hypothetical protein
MAAPLDLIERGEYNHEVPVMIGSVRDETAFFQIKIHTPPHLTELEFDAAQAALSHGVSLQTLKQLYDPAVYEYPEELGNYSRWFWTNMRVGTDKGEWAPSGAIDPDPYIYGLVSVACFSLGTQLPVPGLGPCGVRSLARQLLRGGTPAVYSYFFTHAAQVPVPGIPGPGPGNPFVVHASEIGEWAPSVASVLNLYLY